MSWVALVGPEQEENLGLRYVGASLGAGGFATAILPYNAAEELTRVRDTILTASEPPMVVALSLSFQWRAMDFLSLALALRQGGYQGHITAGGHFGYFCREELLQDFDELDSICCLEAEETLVDLARALRDGRPLTGVGGLALREPSGRVVTTPVRPAPELGRLPWPDRRGEPGECLGHVISPLVGSRGCYGNCAFCCIAAWHKAGNQGRRFRHRPVDDLADEMVSLQRERGTGIFIFHDDNFFLPRKEESLARIHALADALTERGMGRFTTVVKARPPDVTAEVFGAMKERLGLSRLFLGIESDAPQGLRTLRRGVSQQQNHDAMQILDELDLYVCFNLLVFDPDATTESLAENLVFMERYADSPFNFGRVELYAGTPLLQRLEQEGRARGDYLGWDYSMADPSMQRIFELAMRCFRERNFEGDALANRLQGTRFDVEVCRFFHPEVFETGWMEEMKDISRTLALDSVRGLREIIDHVEAGDGNEADLVQQMSAGLRETERALRLRATDLEEAIQQAVGARCRHERPLPAELDIHPSAPVAR